MSSLGRLVDALCESLASFDPALYAGEDCALLAERLARAAKACETASARAAVRAGECGQAGHTPAEFLARAAGCTTGNARGALATVEAVRACPAAEQALRAGEVSLAQAAEIASVPDHEAELLALAKSSGLRAVKDAARTRRLAAIDPDELYAKQRASREFVHWTDDLGMTRFRGALTPEIGVRFINRLDRETDRRWRDAKQAGGPTEARAALAADALVALTDGTATSKPGRTDLVLAVDLRAYRRGHTHDGEVCRIVGDGPLPVDIARQLANDAFLKVVLHDGVAIHTVAHVGRKRPAVLQTALELGAPPDFDGGVCTNKGCDRRYHLQWDHIDPLANGGLTSYDNSDHSAPPTTSKKPKPTAKPDSTAATATSAAHDQRARAPGTMRAGRSGLLPYGDVVAAVARERRAFPVAPAVAQRQTSEARHEVEL